MSDRALLNEKTSKEASVWLARLDRGLREGEGAALRDWLKVPSHRHAILEMARMWHGDDTVAVLSALFPNSRELKKQTRRRRGLLAISLAAVASLCIVAYAGATLDEHMPWDYFGGMDPAGPASTTRVYLTSVGETREVKLPDDSTVLLNTDTRLVVDYRLHSRSVSLSDGEAIFNVKTDADRPFTVRAGRREFQAVGTRFNVRVLTPEMVELTVTDGTVKLLYAPPILPETPAMRREILTYGEEDIGAFETALAQPGFQSVRKVGTREVESRLAWQRGMVIFDKEPLENVLAEVDRYTSTKFALAQAALRNIRVSGYFRAGDVDGLLQTLRKDFRIESRRDAQGRITLTAPTTL